MKYRSSIGALAAVLGLLSACTAPQPANDESAVIAERKAQLITQIDSLEPIVFQAETIDEQAAQALLERYDEYTAKYVGDTARSPEFLYKTAAISRAVGLPAKAIKVYERILADYPNFSKNDEVAFLIAFTYDAEAQRPEMARAAYAEVVSKYPNSSWAQQAQARMATLHLSDEELIRQFEAQNAN